MRTHYGTRPRYGANGQPLTSLLPQPAAGGLRAIFRGVFGLPNPAAGNPVALTPEDIALYTFHQGDLFLPGTGNWALDPPHDTPIHTVWGRGFLRTPNTFSPLQPPQVMQSIARPTMGIGGIVAGQMILEPLADPAGGG